MSALEAIEEKNSERREGPGRTTRSDKFSAENGKFIDAHGGQIMAENRR